VPVPSDERKKEIASVQATLTAKVYGKNDQSIA
jgi:hypothetical protein